MATAGAPDGSGRGCPIRAQRRPRRNQAAVLLFPDWFRLDQIRAVVGGLVVAHPARDKETVGRTYAPLPVEHPRRRPSDTPPPTPRPTRDSSAVALTWCSVGS